jgi:hypothetical protein
MDEGEIRRFAQVNNVVIHEYTDPTHGVLCWLETPGGKIMATGIKLDQVQGCIQGWLDFNERVKNGQLAYLNRWPRGS